jgi:mono/diheme cytochrome c family protein
MYQAYCSGCHGLSGKGDGPVAKTLPVKPADHTRIEMNKYTDQYLFEIISKGGISVGKSSQMPAWGGVLKEPQVKEIVAYVRALSNGRKETAQASGAQSK